MNAPTIIPPPKYVSPPKTWKSKLAMRGFAVICCIIIAGLGGAIATLDEMVEGDFMIILGGCLVIPFIWSIMEGLCIWFRPGNRGIHPGAIVGVDLCISIGLAWLDILMVAVGLLFTPERLIAGYYYHNGRYVGDSDYEMDPEVIALADKIQSRGRALLVFLTFLLITHFVLFVIGCTETHVRNRMPKTVYVVQQPVYAPGPNGQPQYQLAAMPGQYPQQPIYAPQPPVQPIPAAQGLEMKPAAQAQAGPERYA